MVTHFITGGSALCGAKSAVTIGWERDSGRIGDVTCEDCSMRLAALTATKTMARDPTSRNETHVERAYRLLGELLPEMRSRDQAIDNLYYQHPKGTTAVRLASISAALYILLDQRDDGRLAQSAPPSELVALVREWQASSTHFREVHDCADMEVLTAAAKWTSRAADAVRNWRSK